MVGSNRQSQAYGMESVKDRLAVLVDEAMDGKRLALEELVRSIQDRIYGLALRMLYHPQDAEDASQEILIKVITRLDTFRKEGSFEGWVWKIAANHLLSFRRRRGAAALSFDRMASLVAGAGESASWRELEADPVQELIVEEFRIACLQMVLLGLDRPHRLAYILGEVFDVTGKEGGAILDISPAAFRKRLQRARRRVRTFMTENCALIRPGNPCICERQAEIALKEGLMDENVPLFVGHPCHVRHDPAVMAGLQELDELRRVSTLIKRYPGFATPEGFVKQLHELIDSERFPRLQEQWIPQ